jgi:hypothetical protein
MKKFKYYFLILIFLTITFISILISNLVIASSSGYTGVTRKTGGAGCFCHGSIAENVSVSFNGPDSVSPGEAVIYSLVLSGGPLVRGGVDIAAQNGSLDTIGLQGLKKINGELTHINPKAPSGGSIIWQFKYTAPNNIGKDSLYAVGNSVNNNGNTSGDQWNHAPQKVIIIRNPVGINIDNKNLGYKILQNYPNPFNPTTVIKYNLEKNSFVTLNVYNVSGKLVRTLVNNLQQSGEKEIIFDGSNLSNGVYFYKINVNSIDGNNYTQTLKMILVK